MWILSEDSMKALVVGGTGFIGSHIVRDLISKGIQVRILTRNTSINKGGHKGIELKYGDILDAVSLEGCTRDVDLVFSAFGILGQWGIPEHRYRDINTRGVKNLLERCIDSDIMQFIHISSAGVLGPLPAGIIADESFPFNPSNAYEMSKCEAEQHVLDYGKSHGIPFTIIRPEFVYGPGDTHVLGLFKAVKNRQFVLLGNGKSLLHPTYIDDLIKGIGLCTDNAAALGKTYLLAGARPINVQELTEIIAREFEVRSPSLKIPLLLANAASNIFELGAKVLSGFEPPLTKTRLKFFTENRAFSNQKAQAELKYDPKVDLREGVRRTIRWYRDNGYL